GNEEFPNGGPNRTYTVEEDGVVEFWYNDEFPSYILNVSISSSAVYAEVGETINFFDTSTGNPVEWIWEFPGGTPSTSTLQNPLVTYASQGEYSVTLTIKNADNEQQTKTFSDYIKVGSKQTFWWNDAVFYEVFVRSFYDSNSDGKGDIQGLIEKLDYLNDGDPNTDTDLGVTGIWLMPIMQSPSYHGYDATDYRTVEQDYGSNADFVQLVNEAHARGIKVIIDLVMNHTSNQHNWFTESTNTESDKRDWYVWSDTNPGFSGPWGQTVWHYSNGSYFYGLFWSGMPDLNYNTQAVKDEMFDIARFWLEDLNVDGFRLDAVKYIYEEGEDLENLPETIQFWKDFRSYYKSVNPDAFSVGEAWASTQVVMPYVNDDALDY
ncbi:MAG TPA: alpha-amylase family glycosyl hydrolase, partial [Tenuifilaceae bacterium]|nr:alpha-amylase family glycosyl hydrolase [Tenuifilaceae bacterium]